MLTVSTTMILVLGELALIRSADSASCLSISASSRSRSSLRPISPPISLRREVGSPVRGREGGTSSGPADPSPGHPVFVGRPTLALNLVDLDRLRARLDLGLHLHEVLAV